MTALEFYVSDDKYRFYGQNEFAELLTDIKND